MADLVPGTDLEIVQLPDGSWLISQAGDTTSSDTWTIGTAFPAGGGPGPTEILGNPFASVFSGLGDSPLQGVSNG